MGAWPGANGVLNRRAAVSKVRSDAALPVTNPRRARVECRYRVLFGEPVHFWFWTAW